MFGHYFLLETVVYISKVSDKSVLESEECLSYVLNATSFAGDGINYVGAPAGDLPHGFVVFSCCGALYCPCFI